MIFAQIIVWLSIAYLVVGVLFGAWFVLLKIGEFDESAKSAGIGFKFVIFLGMIPFWLLIALRLVRGVRQPMESNSHRRAAGS